MAASRNGWLTVPPFSSAPQTSRWTPALPAPLAAQTPPRHRHPPEGRRDHPSRGSFQPTLLAPTVRTRLLLVFPLSDGSFHGFSHGLPSCFLNTLFHL